jgi:hypothetical protein
MTRSSSAWPREGIHAGPPINALGGVVVNDHIRCAPFALRGDDCCSFSLRSLRRGGGQVSTLRCGRQLLRSASRRACASLGRRTASVAGRSLGGASPRRRGRCRTMSRAMCGAPTGRGRTTAGSPSESDCRTKKLASLVEHVQATGIITNLKSSVSGVVTWPFPTVSSTRTASPGPNWRRSPLEAMTSARPERGITHCRRGAT